MQAIRIVVPATSANLGPGFDCLGLALGLYNEVIMECGGNEEGLPPRPAHVPHLEVLGEGAAFLSHGASNLLLQALQHGIDAFRGSTSPLPCITQVNRIPLARGLGSSAAAIVAGLAAACALAEAPLDRDWILQHATHLEGHPDNVAPAIFGGLTVAFSEDLPTAGEAPRARCLSLPVAGLSVALAVPDFTVSTEDARSCVPGQFPLQDVVFTTSRTALLSGALILGRHDLLREATRDRLHTPYRAPLVRAWAEVEAAALEAGALAVFISGSGPTVGALVAGVPQAAEPVARRMAAAFEHRGCAARPLACAIDHTGVKVERA